MISDEHPNEPRTFRGPGGVTVDVPEKPPEQPDDIRKDLPPGFPPQVHYGGVKCNYWLVLRHGSMPYLDGKKVFSQEVMQWLRSIEKKVEALILK